MSDAQVERRVWRLEELCAQSSRWTVPALIAAFVAGTLAWTGLIYFGLWFADAFPILPGAQMFAPATRLVVSALGGLAAMAGMMVANRNQKARLIRQAEELIASGEQIRAARLLKRATGLELEECVRIIETRLSVLAASDAAGTLPDEVQRLAEAGEQLRAVERLRELSGMGLSEAMRLVEKHLGVRPLWQDLADDPNQKIGAIAAYR